MVYLGEYVFVVRRDSMHVIVFFFSFFQLAYDLT